ncbi:MAG: helix-turn-helix domain-containing protein [Candidatus Paceibacterota bacterium]
MENRYLCEKEVAELTGLALSTLRNYRMESKGFPYVKIGRAVRYSLAEVTDWMDQHKITPGR